MNITTEIYAAQCQPRRGNSNPELMNLELWQWMVRRGCSAYYAREEFGGSPDMAPGWCFARFGMSRVLLPDGRIVLIGGEHEDFYDSDFFIYNDVIVCSPDGTIEIYGYPPDCFPPTDFHSATMVGDQIILVGCLGYLSERIHGVTPVFRLDTTTFEISSVRTEGECPGWIFGHQAKWNMAEQTITIEKGKVYSHGGPAGIRENFDQYQLDVKSWKWTRLTDRRWPHFQVRATAFVPYDVEARLIDEFWPSLPHEKLASPVGAMENGPGTVEFESERAIDSPAFAPQESICFDANDFAREAADLASFDDKDDEAWCTRRIVINGVIVRYVHDGGCVTVTVEGPLPSKMVSELKQDLVAKMTNLFGCTCVAEDLNFLELSEDVPS